MGTDNQNKYELDQEFVQRLEMATQIHFLKKRIEMLEQERDDNSALLVKMWNTFVYRIIPQYFEPRK